MKVLVFVGRVCPQFFDFGTLWNVMYIDSLLSNRTSYVVGDNENMLREVKLFASSELFRKQLRENSSALITGLKTKFSFSHKSNYY